jgi:hypothetical protein
MGGQLNVGLKDFLSERAERYFDYHSGNIPVGGGLVDIPLNGGGIDTSWCTYNATNKKMEISRAGKYRVTFEGYSEGSISLSVGGNFIYSFDSGLATLARIYKDSTTYEQTFSLSQYLQDGGSSLSGDATVENASFFTWNARTYFSQIITMGGTDFVRNSWIANALANGTGFLGVRGKITIQPVVG